LQHQNFEGLLHNIPVEEVDIDHDREIERSSKYSAAAVKRAKASKESIAREHSICNSSPLNITTTQKARRSIFQVY
jgi:hypothetical protein